MNDNNSVMSNPIEGKGYLEVDLYAKGDKGDMFVPSISEEGVLTWTRINSESSITPPSSVTLRNGMILSFVNELPEVSVGSEDKLYAVPLNSGSTDSKKFHVYFFISAQHDPNNIAHYERVDSGYWGSAAASIVAADIAYWNNKANLSDIPDVTHFITKDVDNLTNYELKTATGNKIALSVNTTTYKITATLKNSAGTSISTSTIDLPLESVVVNGEYDATNQKIILTLQNGNTIDIPVGALIGGLQTEITSSNKLSSDLVDDTNKTHKFITAAERTAWNAKSDFSGSYNDLSDKPTIPTVNNAKLTIQKNGTKLDEFTANASTDVTVNVVVPTKTSELTNDSGFVTTTTEVNSNLVNGSSTNSLRTLSATAESSSYTIGTGAFAEGSATRASGQYSHAEGASTVASGTRSHAEGYSTTASATQAHAEGNSTTANAEGAHAEGRNTTASSQYQHVQGKYNIIDSSNTYADIIGNGTSTSARSNASTVDWSGNAWYKGDVYTGGTSQTSGSTRLARISEIPSKTSDLTNDSGYTTNTGTVTKVTAGTGLTGGEITTTGTLALDTSGVVAGTYQGLTIDTYGRVTAATNQGYTANLGTITGVSLNGTSVATSGVANITSVPASILDGSIANGVTATTQQSGDNSTKIATTAYVDSAIAALPGAMLFKGSLGTGGTITSLPTAASSNNGFTYKVITEGIYANQSAKVGDLFISNGSGWILIPSGDEPSGTVTSITLDAVGPIVIDDNSTITTSGSRTISHAPSGVTAGTYTSITVDASGHVTAGTNPGFITATTFATTSSPGMVQTSDDYSILTNPSNGILYSAEKTYLQYADASNNMFISKGTLENVFTEREFLTGTEIKTINGTSIVGRGNITIETGQATMTVPNSDYNVTGGIRTRLDPLTNTLYITNDATDA